MKYIELKTKLLQEIVTLRQDDFYLLEGKLVFKSKLTADYVKHHLEGNGFNIIQTPVRNWDHWQGKYESILYFKDLEKEINSNTSE